MTYPSESAALFFNNGYGVSMQRSSFHYSGSTSHELALMHRVTHNQAHTVCSQTDLAPNGMVGWRNGDDVADFITKAQALPMVEYCKHVQERPE
jgi:hypothetical protein